MFKSFFYANNKEKRIFIIYLMVIAGLTLLISLIIMLVTGQQPETPEHPESASKENLEVDTEITVSEFIMPDPWIRVHETQFHSFREVLSSWGEEQIKAYWISPRKISIEILSEKNDKHIKEIFEGIP